MEQPIRVEDFVVHRRNMIKMETNRPFKNPRESRSRGIKLKPRKFTSPHSCVIPYPCFQTAPILSEPRTLSLDLQSPQDHKHIFVGKIVVREGREEVGEMVRIIPMATSFRPSLSSFRFSACSRFGFPHSSFNLARTVTSLHVGSGKSSCHALEFCLFFFLCFFSFVMLNRQSPVMFFFCHLFCFVFFF